MNVITKYPQILAQLGLVSLETATINNFFFEIEEIEKNTKEYSNFLSAAIKFIALEKRSIERDFNLKIKEYYEIEHQIPLGGNEMRSFHELSMSVHTIKETMDKDRYIVIFKAYSNIFAKELYSIDPSLEDTYKGFVIPIENKETDSIHPKKGLFYSQGVQSEGGIFPSEADVYLK